LHLHIKYSSLLHEAAQITYKELEVKRKKMAEQNSPKPELDKFRLWFEKFDAELWDKQFEDELANIPCNRL
jgi:hypothetical protein